MSSLFFLFDLDSTITKQEILPTVSKMVSKEKEMRELTEKTMQGELPFKESFLQRVDILNNVFCSKALYDDDKLSYVVSVIDKSLICEQFVHNFVAIGDGNNDADMVKQAKYGIGFGGVRPIANALIENADYAFYSDKKLYDFLNKLK